MCIFQHRGIFGLDDVDNTGEQSRYRSTTLDEADVMFTDDLDLVQDENDVGLDDDDGVFAMTGELGESSVSSHGFQSSSARNVSTSTSAAKFDTQQSYGNEGILSQKQKQRHEYHPAQTELTNASSQNVQPACIPAAETTSR